MSDHKKKSLNERNFTQINLASVFESLRLSNRLASLEGKQYHSSQGDGISINTNRPTVEDF